MPRPTRRRRAKQGMSTLKKVGQTIKKYMPKGTPRRKSVGRRK